MAQIDRSRFKPTRVAETEAADKEVAAIVGSKNGPPDYLSLTGGTGVHKWRIFPPHPDDGGNLYAVPKGVHFLPCDVPKKDADGKIIKDKNGNEVTEIKNKPVFNARIHGGQRQDVVEEYIKFAQRLALENYPGNDKKSETERFKFLEPIMGNRKTQNKTGIQLQQKWVMYVMELLGIDKKQFGRLEVGKAVKDRLNNLAASESAEEPLGTDPFTDIDSGFAIITTYNKEAEKPQDFYKTEFYKPSVAGDKSKVQLFPMTDEDLEQWLKSDSLKKMFINVYDSKTFDIALNGLKNLDTQNKIGVFEHEEFLEIVNTLLKDIPQAKEDIKDNKSDEEDDEEEGDQFDQMDRDELKDCNNVNKLGIVVKKSMTDDQLRELVREAMINKDANSTDDEEEDDEEEDSTPASETKAVVTDEETGLPWDKDGNDAVAKSETSAESKGSNLKANDLKNRLANIKAKKGK